MSITVEIKNWTNPENAEIAICVDETGLQYLIDQLNSLKGRSDHIHLMTPAWAGDELSEISQGGDNYRIVNHLRIVKK